MLNIGRMALRGLPAAAASYLLPLLLLLLLLLEGWKGGQGWLLLGSS
jgi:hypothetical protein